MGFPRQEYWSRLPFPSPGELPNPGIKLVSPALQMDSLPLSHLGGKKKWSEVAQLCLTLCDPMDCSLSGSSVHGIFQARVLDCIAISFFRGSSWPRNWTWVSRIAGRRFTVWATREAHNWRQDDINVLRDKSMFDAWLKLSHSRLAHCLKGQIELWQVRMKVFQKQIVVSIKPVES